jgi:hypothetical protein
MPIEIRELVIKTTVLAAPDGQPEQPVAAISLQQIQQLRREIIQACTRQLQEQQKRSQAARR